MANEIINSATEEYVDSKVGSEKIRAEGVEATKADLVDGKVPASQLPSYVDDVLEFSTREVFPVTGEAGKIYIAKDTNKQYRWSGTQYVELGGGGAGEDTNAVHYYAETKTAAEKAQARQNIGAMSADTPIPPAITLDDEVTKNGENGVKSSGIWTWVKSLLPDWLKKNYAEPATVASVKAKLSDSTADYDAAAAYSVGVFAKHDGVLYVCKTAIATGGEAWNPAHWTAMEDVATLFSNANSSLVGVIDARLPYPLNTDGTIKDRARNVVTNGAFVIPEGFHDLLIRYTGVPTSLTFSGTDASIADYGDDLPTETGDYLITVTRTKAAECYIRIIKLEARA